MGTMKVGVLRASRFGGVELLRICGTHPEFEVVYGPGDSQAGAKAASLYPSLAAAYPDLVFQSYDAAEASRAGLDLLFCAMPHGQSQKIVPVLRNKVRCIV